MQWLLICVLSFKNMVEHVGHVIVGLSMDAPAVNAVNAGVCADKFFDSNNEGLKRDDIGFRQWMLC